MSPPAPEDAKAPGPQIRRRERGSPQSEGPLEACRARDHSDAGLGLTSHDPGARTLEAQLSSAAAAVNTAICCPRVSPVTAPRTPMPSTFS